VAYEQADILWAYFAQDYVNLSIPALRKIPELWGISEESSVLIRWILKVPGVTRDVAPDQIQFLNPLFVLIFVPLFSWLLGKIDPNVRVFTATKKILIGFALTAGSAAIVSTAGYLNESTGEKVSIVWVAMAYVVLTAGEVLLYGTGLELAYTAAPKNMKGFVTACFLLTNMLGNLINLYFCDIYGGKLSDPIDQRGLFLPGGLRLILMPGAFFAVTASIVVAATIGFYFVGRRFDRQPQAENA
jgi:dipeptide/tripeptide permease